MLVQPVEALVQRQVGAELRKAGGAVLAAAGILAPGQKKNDHGDFVCGEADITEQSEDGLDGAGENTLQENEDCPYFCPVCGECIYEEDCEE